MGDKEYHDRLALVWDSSKEHDYREKLWVGWANFFYPDENPRTYLKTWMDENEAANVNWWRPSWVNFVR